MVQFLPFLLVTWLANLADAAPAGSSRRARLARLTYLLVALFYTLLLAIGLTFWVAGQFSVSADRLRLLQTDVSAPLDPQLLTRIIATLPRIGAGLASSAFLGLLLLLPRVRRGIARLLPLDPERTVHGLALAFTGLVIVNMAVVLSIGLGTLTDLALARSDEMATALQRPGLILGLWMQQLVTALWALIGVGWWLRRSLGAAFMRLGIVWPSPLEMLAGVGGGLTALVVTGVLGGLASGLGIGLDPDVQSLNDVLIGPLFTSLPGILTIGLAAALGEETLFRGALQPRFGLWITTLLFAVTHSNYGLSLSTLFVFGAGLIFALLRARFNTTTAMIGHATYNTSLGLLALLASHVMGS